MEEVRNLESGIWEIVIVAARHGRSRPYLDNPFVFPLHPLDLVVATTFIYLTRLLTDSPTHYSPTHRRAHPSARSLESHHHLTHRPVYLCILISSLIFLTLILIHDTILFLSYHIHLITPSYNCIVYHPHPQPHQSFLYIRNTEICSHGIFSSLSLSLLIRLVSSRLVSVRLFFASFLLNFVRSIRKDRRLAWTFCLYCIYCTYNPPMTDCRLGLC